MDRKAGKQKSGQGRRLGGRRSTVGGGSSRSSTRGSIFAADVPGVGAKLLMYAQTPHAGKTISKIKLVDSHPTKPWIGCADVDGCVVVWDLESRSTVYQILPTSRAAAPTMTVSASLMSVVAKNRQDLSFIITCVQFSEQCNAFVVMY